MHSADVDLLDWERRATTTQNLHRITEVDYPGRPRHNSRLGLLQDCICVRVCVGAAASTEGQGSKDENSGCGGGSRLLRREMIGVGVKIPGFCTHFYGGRGEYAYMRLHEISGSFTPDRRQFKRSSPVV